MKTALLALAGVSGGLAIVSLMVVSVVDATSRAFGAPILGAKEITEVLMVLCVSAALPVSVLKGRTISIDGLVLRFPIGLKRAVVAAGSVVSVAAMSLLAWRLVVASGDARDFAETTALLQVPHYPLYLVLATGTALTALSFVLHAASLSNATDHE